MAELDLLRFITASAVVLFHYTFRGPVTGQSPQTYWGVSQVSRYGFLGVEMFFLISGFVIPMSASGVGVKQFFASRLSRLYPAFWVCCTLTFAVTVLWGAPRYHASVGQYLVNMTMLAGFAEVKNMDEVYHTLYIEIVWYAIIGGLLAIAAARRRGRPALLILALPAPILLASGLVTGVLGQTILGTAGKSFIGAYWMYFLGGYLFYRLWAFGPRLWHVPAIGLCWVAGVAASMRYIPNFQDEIKVTLNPIALGVGVTLCFVAMLCIAKGWTGPLARRNWTVLGALTYPLYLIHQVVGMVILRHLGSSLNKWVALVLVFCVAMGIAYCVNRWVERPSARPLRRAVQNLLDRAFPPADQIRPARHRRGSTA